MKRCQRCGDDACRCNPSAYQVGASVQKFERIINSYLVDIRIEHAKAESDEDKNRLEGPLLLIEELMESYGVIFEGILEYRS